MQSRILNKRKKHPDHLICYHDLPLSRCEEWRKHPTLPGLYVSSLGRAKRGASKFPKRILRSFWNRYGVLEIKYMYKSNSYNRALKQAVADTFLPGTGHVRMKDGDEANCAVFNLYRAIEGFNGEYD